jgi:hypothetical protein
MKANEILVRVMENTMMQDGKQYTQTRMAEELSEKSGKTVSVAAVNDRLKNENMKISNFIEMLDLLGYEVVARPKNDKRESYVVDPGTDRKRVK